MIGLYAIINKTNWKFYFGSSSNVEKRYAVNQGWTEHHNVHLRNAAKKYGNENFILKIISEHNTYEEALLVEQMWIDYFCIFNDYWHLCYNISRKAYGGNLGEEANTKRNKTQKEKFISGEIKVWCKGHTKETDERLAKAGKKISESKKKSYASGKTISWCKGYTKETDERLNITSKKLNETFAKSPEKIHKRNVKISKALKGRSKETHEYIAKIDKMLKGRTKEEYEYLARQSKKRTGQTKKNCKRVAKISKTLSGRTKETHEHVMRISKMLKGHTKETHEYLIKTSERINGEKSPFAKLTNAQAKEIRKRAASSEFIQVSEHEKYKLLSIEYDVTAITICRILLHITFKNV